MSNTIIIAAGAGAVIGALGTYVAARRTVVQPVEVAPAEEAVVVGEVLSDPRRYRSVVVLKPSDFAWGPHRALWEMLGEEAVEDTDPDHVAEARAAELPSLMLPYTSSELVAKLDDDGLLDGIDVRALEGLTTGDRPADGDATDDASSAEPGTDVDTTAILEAATAVQAAGWSREFDGATPPEAGETPEVPLVRSYRAPSTTRTVATTAVAASALAAIAWVGPGGYATVAAAVLIALSVIVGLVDIDTLYVDMLSLACLGVLSLTAATAAAADAGALGNRAVLALVVTGVTIIILEGVAWVWGRARHTVGLGGGDSFLLAPVLAVPVLATGSTQASIWGLLAALTLTIVGQSILIVAGRSTRETPFAWGPYIVAGWPIGWTLAMLAGAS